jgi:eukaryotic-like serine/threonine-protein kinase
VFGTAAYLAPEQARGERVDARADVYALGVVLYEMLAGRPPFEADSALAVASKHVFEQPEPPSAIRPDIPPPIEAVAMRALEKNPGDRYPGAAEMAAALGAPVDDGSRAATSPVAAAPTVALSDRTEVLPPVRGGTHVAPRRGPPWGLVWVALLVVGLLLAVLLPALLGSGKGRNPLPLRLNGGTGHHATHRATTPKASAHATSAPPTSAPPTTAPPTSAPAPPAVPSVGDAATLLQNTIADALAAGAIDDHTAGDLAHGLDESLKKYTDGDLDKALESISQAKDKLAKALDRGDASADAAAAIGPGFDQLGAAMQAAPPPSPNEGGPPGPDKHGPKHDHGD